MGLDESAAVAGCQAGRRMSEEICKTRVGSKAGINLEKLIGAGGRFAMNVKPKIMAWKIIRLNRHRLRCNGILDQLESLKQWFVTAYTARFKLD